MLKNVKISKVVSSFIIILLLVILFGNIYSLADETTKTITATTGTNSNEDTNNTVNNATTNNTNNATNNTTNNSVNNVTNNTSVYNNKTNTSKLPYTGTNSRVSVLLIVVLIGSAFYAYKKVSDYNM